MYAARKNPRDATLAPRLASVLTSRNFLLPAGPPLKFPARIVHLHYVEAGRKIAVYCEDGTIGFIDTATSGHVRTRLPTALASPWVVFTGPVTLVRGEDDVIRVLQPETGDVKREFNFGQKIARISARNADEPVVFAVLEDRSMVVAETLTGRTRWLPLELPETSRVELSPDGRWMALSDASSRDWQLWDMVTGERRATREIPGTMEISAFSPDGTRLLAIYLADIAETSPFTFQLWSVPDAAPLTEPAAVRAGQNANLVLTFSPDGRVFSIASQDCQQVYETASGTRVGPFLETGVLRFATLPGEIGRQLKDGIPSGGSQSNSRGPIFLEPANGLRFVTASGINAPVELTVRDVATGRAVAAPLTHDRGVRSAWLSEDGTSLVGLGDVTAACCSGTCALAPGAWNPDCNKSRSNSNWSLRLMQANSWSAEPTV